MASKAVSSGKTNPQVQDMCGRHLELIEQLSFFAALSASTAETGKAKNLIFPYSLCKPE